MQNQLRLTFNLNQIVQSLQKGIDSVFEKAFVDIYDREEETLQKLLLKFIEEALTATPEYNIPEFSTSLKEVALEPGIIVARPNKEINYVIISIPFGEYAGDIEDYGNAVRLARQAGNFGIYGDPKKASEFWKEFVYQPAREGRAGNTEFYFSTLELRRQYYQSIAPYWQIINYGGDISLKSDRGGEAYPSVPKPTNFLEKAESSIENYFNQSLEPEINQLFSRLQAEIASVYNFVYEVERTVTDERYQPKEYIEPQIIREFDIARRKYKLYITRTGKLGLSLRPEI